MRTALLMIVLAGCTSVQARRVNRVGAALTVASMACDWTATRWKAGGDRVNWEQGFPARPIMGATPTVGRVDAYFAATTAIVLALAQLVPERYRWVGYSAAVGVEVVTVAGNTRNTPGICGL